MNAASGIVHRIRDSGPGSLRAGATLLLLLTWSVALATPLAVHGWAAGGHVTLEQQASHLLAIRRTSEHQHGLLTLHAHDARGGVTIGPALLAGRDHGASTTLTLWQAVLLAALPLLAAGGWRRRRWAGDRLTSHAIAIMPRPPRRPAPVYSGAGAGRAA